jgi:hypothetical protein
MSMNEAKWLGWTHPDVMVGHLIGHGFRQRFGRRRDRKLHLLACACCRYIWHLLTEERARKALEVCERYENQPIDRVALEAAGYATSAASSASKHYPGREACRAVWGAVQVALGCSKWLGSVFIAARVALRARAKAAGCDVLRAELGFRRDQVHIIRDVFGNPFRPVTLEPIWLVWRDRTVCRLAQAIYDERRFADLPILADALEDAGCDNADILDHCRRPGEHVRGCWVVDALLGKS